MEAVNRSDTKPRKCLEDVLKQINRECVQIKKKDRKCNNAVLYAVLGKLLKMMRTCDELFSSMKPKLDYLGSYFDGLRVGQPSEYDLNVILKLPVNYKKIKLDATQTAYDHTSVILSSEFRRLSKTPEMAKKGYSKTRMWCDEQYRLSSPKFRSWMQSVVDAALSKLPLHNGKRVICVNNKYYQIFAKMSGPANTITIITDSVKDNIIDVDLVPTFEFELPKKPIGSKVLFENLECTELKKYFVVPKPSDNDFSWRLAFPFQERYYINNKNNLKSTVKLIKLLRDVQGFKQLASYFIKTVFLWETKMKPDDFWKTKSLSYLLVHMMKILRDCLEKGEIKNFWCPDFNLIKNKIKLETCQNWSNRLTFIINDIEQRGKENPQIVLQYFMSSTKN